MLIKFIKTKKGKRAYRIGWNFRMFPMKLKEAEMLIATGQAQETTETL